MSKFMNSFLHIENMHIKKQFTLKKTLFHHIRNKRQYRSINVLPFVYIEEFHAAFKIHFAKS